MKNVIITVCLVITSTISIAQGKAIKFSKDGNSYYQSEMGSIVQFSLPSLDKKVVVKKEELIPTGKTSNLSIKSFSFSNDESKVLVFTNSRKVWRYDTRGDYWVFDVASKKLQKLGANLPSSSLMFAKFSPDGTKAAYVSKHNIYVEDIATSTITQLTQDGTDRMINGTFDWVYEEELSCRDGFRWSNDSKHISYWQIDATQIKNFLMINNTDSIYPFTIPVEYPKVGENPSAYKIGVVDIATSKTNWMNIPGDNRNSYLPRMEWMNNEELIMEQLSRKQNESKILVSNINSGKTNVIHTETSETWIDGKGYWNNDDPTGWDWINGGKEFLWVSEKDGWRHIYAISKDGKSERKIITGNHDMISFKGVDEKNGYVYYMASPDNATQQYLYRASLKGSVGERVSPVGFDGTHSYTISTNGQFAKHSLSSVSSMPSNEWVSLPQHSVFGTSTIKKPNTSGGIEFFKVTTDDNITMDGYMIKPRNFDSTKKYPVVFYVYTEPATQTVTDTYGSAGNYLYAGDMAADGYIQISLDGRGTPAPKGAAWRKAIYKNVGRVNVRDQAMAAKKIMNWKFIDADRIAVWGWSGGGTTTLHLMFQYPEIYKTGIAIAPVTSRLCYDNIYEERYMGLPQENKSDFEACSPITYAKNLEGDLLIIHGTGDDNVHYQNTELLINELVKNGKQFSMMSYPNRTHSLGEGEGTFGHLAKLYTKFLKEHCKGGGR
ncbi:MAG: S9 family peptidase [Chitinophagaceae bacterium]